MQLNINTREVVAFTNKLEKMHKSVLPRTIRETLNYAALQDTKQDTMLKSAAKNFKDERTRLNFFKANSKVNFAKGWNVKGMKSEVGFSGSGNKSQAVEDLEKQERGGVIGGKAFIPLNDSRAGGKYNRAVRPRYRISDIKNRVVDSSRNDKGKTHGQRFILSSIHAGVGGFVIGGKSRKFLFEITGISRDGFNTKIKSKAIYSVQKSRKIKVQPTQFMRQAQAQSVTRIEQNYIKFAKQNMVKYKFK